MRDASAEAQFFPPFSFLLLLMLSMFPGSGADLFIFPSFGPQSLLSMREFSVSHAIWLDARCKGLLCTRVPGSVQHRMACKFNRMRQYQERAGHGDNLPQQKSHIFPNPLDSFIIFLRKGRTARGSTREVLDKANFSVAYPVPNHLMYDGNSVGNRSSSNLSKSKVLTCLFVCQTCRIASKFVVPNEDKNTQIRKTYLSFLGCPGRQLIDADV